VRPQSIILFERLYIASILLSLIGALGMMQALPTIAPNIPPGAAAFIPTVVIGSALFGLAIGLLLLYFVARRGSDVARWIFVAFFLFALVGLVRRTFGHSPITLPLWLNTISLVQILLHAGCVWLLFRPDSKIWFKR
jgi:hypothetical protein